MGSPDLRPDRPVVVTPVTKTDIVLEAIALIGVLAGVAMAAYGAVSLPDTIPVHVRPGGYIDSYGSKWVLITLLIVSNIVFYVFITFINRYPQVFNYPVVITAQNAPGSYRASQRMMRWLKLIFCWLFTVMLGWFVLVMPYHPERSAYTILVTVPFLALIVVIILFSVISIVKESYAA